MIDTRKLSHVEDSHEPIFDIDGSLTPLSEALRVNADDAHACAWLRRASVGESYEGGTCGGNATRID